MNVLYHIQRIIIQVQRKESVKSNTTTEHSQAVLNTIATTMILLLYNFCGFQLVKSL